MNSKERGFTLIELLVVIAIIGMLSSVVLASLNQARTKARDARRMSDIKQLQLALEFYYDKNGEYPDNPNATGGNTVVANMKPGANTAGVDITPFINPIPADPTKTGTAGYRYAVGTANQAYTLLVSLERNNNSWCSVNVAGGWVSWNGDSTDGSGGTNYVPCNFQ